MDFGPDRQPVVHYRAVQRHDIFSKRQRSKHIAGFWVLRMSLFDELKRRNVIRVAIAYLVVAWLLAQVVDLVLENFGAPGWFMRSLLVVLAAGLPVVVIFAWAFEITPEGIKKEGDVDRSQSVTHHTGRKLDRVIIGVLVVIIAFFALDRFVLQDRAESVATQNTVSVAGEDDTVASKIAEGPSIAVLPFVNMSSDAENEYFSDGLTETLLNMLAQLPELRVAARTSSFAFKGKNTDIVDIAKALGVAHVLEGSVQKAGDRVRVTAQLIRANDGFHVWSQNYTRPLQDIFAIQDEIAADVARAMGASLLGEKSTLQNVETSNLAAYDLYLQGLQQHALSTFTSLPEAESLFKQALAIDPGFTDAQLALAGTYLQMQWTGQIDRQTTQQNINPLLQQVRAHDPENPLARALELDNELYSDDALSAEEYSVKLAEMENLLPLVPTQSELRSRLAVRIAAISGDYQRALNVVDAGLLVDPLDAVLYRRRGVVLQMAGRLDEALAALLRGNELRPDDPNILNIIAEVETDQGNLKQALIWKRRAAEADPLDHELASNVAIVLYELGLPEEGDRWANKVEALAAASGVGRMTSLYKAMAHNNTDGMLDIAKSMIKDQVDLRQGAFASALFTYVETMSKSGQAKQAYDFLQSSRPDIFAFDDLPADRQGQLMQYAAIMMMYDFATPEATLNAWLSHSDNMDRKWPRWREDSFNEVVDLILKGQTDQAEQLLLENELSRPISTNLKRADTIRAPFFESINQRPAVVTRLIAIDKEVAALRGEVSEMLLEPEWSP